MPADLVSRINLDLLEPKFRDNLLNLLAEARGLGFVYFATEGYRTFERSRQLYDAYKKGGPRASPAGLSAHNYGLAVDLCRRIGTKGVSWKEADYEPLRDLCPKHGLDWGGHFKDPPHIGDPRFVKGKDLLRLRVLLTGLEGTLEERLNTLWRTM